MSRIRIIIVNWNTGKLLTRCVQSLQTLPERNLIDSIVVIDNASHDNSLVWLRQKIAADTNPPVHITASPTNLGFARANNQAVAQGSTGHGPGDPHIFLLNPDTEVKPGALATLVQTLEHNQAVGVVGPKLLHADGSLQPSVRQFPSAGVLAMFFLKLGRLLPHTGWGRKYLAQSFDYNKRSAVDQVMGAAFLIRNAVWQHVGTLDESFWVWFEEVDYCRRVKNAGWQVMFDPAATVTHHGAASFNQLIGTRRTLPFLRSALRYSAKHLGYASTVSLLALFPAALCLAIPAAVFHRRSA